MAAEFLESIYKKSLIISDLEESVSHLQQCNKSAAQKSFNRAGAEIEALLPELAESDPALAKEIISCAGQIAEAWEDQFRACGLISKTFIPLMYRYMSYFSDVDVEDGRYRIMSTDSGFLNLTDSENSFTFHDTHNPMVSAEKLAKSLYKPTMSEIHILGCGMGYLPYVLYKKSAGAIKIYIYESDLRVPEYAERYGVLSWVPKGCLELVLEEDPIKCAGTYLDVLNSKNTDIDSGSADFHISPWKSVQYKKLGIDTIEKQAEINCFNREHFNICVINMMKNYQKKLTAFDELKARLSCDEWVVVAAGPSLDYNMEYLRQSKGKRAIAAVNTVIKRLSAEDIKPELITAADPMPQLADHLRGYEDFTAGCTLIADESSSWNFIDSFRGDICLVPTPNGEGLPLSNPQNLGLWKIYGTVSSLAIEASIRLGAKKIHLVGLDLAYPDGISYARGVSQARSEDRKGDCQVMSVEGRMIDSSKVFDMFRGEIEAQIALHPDIEFINHSRNGALIKGATGLKE